MILFLLLSVLRKIWTVEMLLKPNEAVPGTYQLLFIAKDTWFMIWNTVTVWDLEVRNPIGEGLGYCRIL